MGSNMKRRQKKTRTQEMITAYDEAMHPIGDFPRSYVHRNSMWHQVCHCWIIGVRQGSVRLFLQRRSYEKKSHPGKYDITSGGHITAGEEPRVAMVREIREETGIIIRPEELIEIGRYREDAGHDKEIANLFLSIQGDPPFRPGHEVSYMVSADMEEYREMCEGTRDMIEVIPAIRTGPMLHEKFFASRDQFSEHDSFLNLVYPFIKEYVRPYIEQYR